MSAENSGVGLEGYLARAGAAAAGGSSGGRLWREGREVGEWTVAGFVGRGGSAEAYCARHRRLGTAAVLKVLWRDGEGPRARFDRETRFLMESPGPSFPTFLGTGTEEGRPWVAMELLEEYPLPSTDAAVAAYLLDVARGVEELHRRGWVHRDLKPRNILRRESDGHAVLIDFGLLKRAGETVASETAAGRVSPSVVDGREVGVGTPGYAAPEQFVVGAATPATDVHALGMLADECFDGKPPRVWERIIRRATGSLPRQRYADAAAMARAIRRRHWLRNAAWLALACALAVAAAAFWRAAEGPQKVPEEPGQSESSESSEFLPPAEPVAVPKSAGEEAERALSEAIQGVSEEAGQDLGDAMSQDMEVLEGAEGQLEVSEEPGESEPPKSSEFLAPAEPAVVPRSPGEEAERMRLEAVQRASEGGGREIVDGILQDMVVLEGAEELPNSLREIQGEGAGPVLIARHEVTQAQWEALMEHNPSRFRGADRPVDGVCIGDCLEFLGRLNRMPNVRAAGVRFRLPTEEEWDLAAGEDHYSLVYSHVRRADSFLKMGWFADNSGNETHPVGQKSPNSIGLYDHYGNVAEVVFSLLHKASVGYRAFEIEGLCCEGGSCIQSLSNLDFPVVLAPLGRDPETLPEEWQFIMQETDISVSLPEAMAKADPESVADFLGRAVVGLRLCADKMPVDEQKKP